jgi:hypothetical protein
LLDFGKTARVGYQVTEIDGIVDTFITEAGLQPSSAVWKDDWILSRALAPLGNRVVSVSTLAQPLRMITSARTSVVVFDYAYFVFLRSLCRALARDGDTAGALISLYHFELGTHLSRTGFAEEAAGLLRSACELRATFSVYQDVKINEALLYELAVNICVAHEQAHKFFADDAAGKEAWLREARGFLDHLNENAPRMFSDQDVQRELKTAIELYLSSDTQLEEVACDLCAVDHSIEHALARRADKSEQYINAYFAAARLTILALYVARTLAHAAALVAQQVRGAQLRAGSEGHVSENQSVMSDLRVRFQTVLMKILQMKVKHGLISGEPGFRKVEGVLQTNEESFARLMAYIAKEFQEVMTGATIYRHLWVAHARRAFGVEASSTDNAELIGLYLREFWFSRIDL